MAMSEEELIAALRLQHVPNVGDVTAKKLIAHCGSPASIFDNKAHHLRKIEGIGSLTVRGLFDKAHREAAEAEFKYIRDARVDYSYFMDEDYPSYLKHCIDGPILIFKRGAIDLKGRRIISVVGTRQITGYGKAFCERFIADLAPLDPIIVSGFAYGVDIAIQKAAMDQGLQTIGCLAHGVDQNYPKIHARYRSRIEQHGGFLTEFWSTAGPEREHFLRRNRIIAGMSEATVVVESAERGGSLVTADLALGYNRDVFAVPGRVHDPFSVGCNNLIKQQKAHLLTSAADLVYLLGWELEERKPQLVQKELFVDMNNEERNIYDYLLQEGKQLLDSIALECRLPIFKTSSALLTMEMKGLVRPLPGKFFEAI